MSVYQCKLLQKSAGRNEYVAQNFFREGESAKSVLEGLEMFEFGEGKWVITEYSNDEE